MMEMSDDIKDTYILKDKSTKNQLFERRSIYASMERFLIPKTGIYPKLSISMRRNPPPIRIR
jgi:hypothetical protein